MSSPLPRSQPAHRGAPGPCPVGRRRRALKGGGLAVNVLMVSVLAVSACGGDPDPAPSAPAVPSPAASGAPAPSVAPAAGASPDDSPLARPPDVVLVVIDTLRADHLPAYGYGRDTAPALSAIAREGLRFTRAYAQSGWTLASMATLFTGLYPHQHRVARDGCQPEAFGYLDPARVTLAEALRARGYRAGAWVNNTFMAPTFGLNQGFEPYDYVGATNDTHRTAAETVDRGLAWLDRPEGAGQPAFLVLHFMEPHLDYAPPADLRGTFTQGPPAGRLGSIPLGAFQTRQATPTEAEKAYMVDLYDEEIRAADRGLAALVAGLEARGRLDNTLLIVTADHGEEFWDHGGFEHGHALWSELTRVPLVLRGPGVPKNARNDTVVEHVDLVRGIAAATGAQLDPAVGGVSIFDVASGPPLPRTALSENCLYGPSCVSITDGQRRFLLQHQLVFPEGAGRDLAQAKVRPVADVFPILPSGLEGPRMARAEAEAVAPGYARMLEAKRGSLAPLAARDGAAVPDFQTFQMLKELGYVDRPDAAAQPQTPCR